MLNRANVNFLLKVQHVFFFILILCLFQTFFHDNVDMDTDDPFAGLGGLGSGLGSGLGGNFGPSRNAPFRY